MNTNKPAHKAKIRHLCFFLVLCLHLAYGAVPGPCKHSVTKDHLLNLKRLIGNQLQNGCSITYNFTERQSLSEICYIKAAFPHILDLLTTHFRYGKNSDNYIYTSSLKNLIYNIYSQKCIPPINEEIENNPIKFAKLYTTSPKVGLEKAEEVIQMYMNLVTKNDKAVRWNCADEFAEDYPEYTTTLPTQTSGTPECPCSYTKIPPTSLKASVMTRSSIHAPTSVSPNRPSWGFTLKPKNEGSKVPEHAVKQKAPVSMQTQPFPVSPYSELSSERHTSTELFSGEHYSSAHGDFLNHILTATTDLIDDSLLKMESLSSLAISSPITPLTKTTRMPQRRTVFGLQSATSQPSQRSITPLGSDRSTALVLAKRSLDNKVQGIKSDFYPELPQSWITTTTTDPAGIHKKGSHLQITSGETVNSPFPTLHADKKIIPKSATAPKSFDISEDILEFPPAEQALDISTPTPKQTHLHKAASLPKNVIKAFNEATDCKDSKFQKDTKDIKDQISRDYVEGLLGKDFQLTSSFTMFIITSVCISLLLFTAILLCKQQRNMRQFLQWTRRSANQRSSIYHKIEL